jgi:hypothetical protein
MICVVNISMVLTIAPFLNAFAQNNNPGLAENIYQDKSLDLPQNIKHLVILITIVTRLYLGLCIVNQINPYPISIISHSPVTANSNNYNLA